MKLKCSVFVTQFSRLLTFTLIYSLHKTDNTVINELNVL